MVFYVFQNDLDQIMILPESMENMEMFPPWLGCTDVTLVCDNGQRLWAHKIILGLFSSTLRAVLETHPEAEAITLAGTNFEDLTSQLRNIYDDTKLLCQTNTVYLTKESTPVNEIVQDTSTMSPLVIAGKEIPENDSMIEIVQDATSMSTSVLGKEVPENIKHDQSEYKDLLEICFKDTNAIPENGDTSASDISEIKDDTENLEQAEKTETNACEINVIGEIDSKNIHDSTVIKDKDDGTATSRESGLISNITDELMEYVKRDWISYCKYKYSCTLCTYSSQVKYIIACHVQSHFSSDFIEKIKLEKSLEGFSKKRRPRKQYRNRQKCDYCEELFKTITMASEHVESTHPDKKQDEKYLKYPCTKSNCVKVFFKANMLNMHYKRAHKDFVTTAKALRVKKEIFNCLNCDKKFHEQSDFENHMEKKHQCDVKSVQQFQCAICDKLFRLRTKMEKHMHLHDSLTAICPLCGKASQSKREMYNHQHYHKAKLEKKVYWEQNQKECCGTNFSSYNKWLNHSFKVHDFGAMFCDVCGKKLLGKAKLELHKTQHKEGNALTEEIPCSKCDRKFDHKYKLKSHMVYSHKPNDEKKHKCTHCGKGFNFFGIFQDHLNVHSGLKPWLCEYCETAFNNKSNMLAHMRKSCKVKVKQKKSIEY